MSKHNYTNPAFCQNSEFYPVPSSSSAHVESIYNRSLQLNFSAVSQRQQNAPPSRDPREGPLRMQRSMSTRSVTRKQYQQQQQQQQQLQHPQKQQQQKPKQEHKQSASGRYALVPLEELGGPGFIASRYAIVPGQAAQRLARSQDDLDRYSSRHGLQSDEEPHSFHEEPQQQQETQFASLPPTLNAVLPSSSSKPTPKIKHAFSSDFGSKTFLIVDKNSNQRYQMVPTAEDEELVDENQEIIQMHNGRAHRYAVIPTEADDDELDEEEEDSLAAQAALEQETCLSNMEPQQQQQQQHYGMRTSTPQQQQQRNAAAATRALHELLSTPRKMQPPPRLAHSTPRNAAHHEQLQRERRLQLYQSQQFINMNQQTTVSVAPVRQQRLSPQRLHYETVKPATVAAPPPPPPQAQQLTADRSMAVISPRVQQQQQQQQQQELDLSSLQGKAQRNNNNSYPQKLANATITLAIVSLMLVVGSTMNAGLIIYMIAHFGKSFYLQFGLVASFCGIGLGFLGFRSRHCEWLPNRSYTSGYILVTIFCLFKCCGLLLILVLDPFPGLPLHDVTTGVILGLSTFTMFFIGLGVIGSLWCYRPPPDNRVNVL